MRGEVAVLADGVLELGHLRCRGAPQTGNEGEDLRGRGEVAVQTDGGAERGHPSRRGAPQAQDEGEDLRVCGFSPGAEYTCRACGTHDVASFLRCRGVGRWFCNSLWTGTPSSCIISHLDGYVAAQAVDEADLDDLRDEVAHVRDSASAVPAAPTDPDVGTPPLRGGAAAPGPGAGAWAPDGAGEEGHGDATGVRRDGTSASRGRVRRLRRQASRAAAAGATVATAGAATATTGPPPAFEVTAAPATLLVAVGGGGAEAA